MSSGKLQQFCEALHDQPVIAAVKNQESIDRALETDCSAIFILQGTILNIPDLVARVRDAGRFALVHADLIEGMAGKEISVDYLAQNTRADGIISTRPNMIRRARELGLISIQRFFLLDSLSIENVLRQSSNADLVDILPGVMPQVIRHLTGQMRDLRFAEKTGQGLIVSGLLREKSDVIAALSAGAMAVSTTCEKLWFE